MRPATRPAEKPVRAKRSLALTSRFANVAALAALLAFVATFAMESSALARKHRKKRAKPAPTLAVELETQLWDILERGTRSGDIPARGLAVEAITYLRPADSLKYATESLKDPQWKVRAGALRALIRLGNSAYEKPLQDALVESRLDLANDVLPLLEILPEKRALALLFGVLDSPKVPRKRPIVDALATRGGPLAKAAFERALVGRSSVLPVFRDVIGKLSVHGDGLVLLAIAAKSADTDTLRAVLKAARALPSDVDTALLHPLLKTKDDALRVAAAELLASRGDKASIPVLLPLVESPDLETKIRVIHALAGVPTPKVVSAVYEMYTQSERPPKPEDFARITDAVFAVHAAAGDGQLIPALQNFLRGTDATIRAVAVKHMGKMQGAVALPVLHELLFDGNPTVRESAARSIGIIAHSESIPHLQRALDDRVPAVRRAVSKALGEIHDKVVVDVVAFLVSDSDAEVRKGAAQALANAHHESALPGLRLALRDRDPEIRLIAFRGLLEQDSAGALRDWRGMLNWLRPGDIEALAKDAGAGFQPFLELAIDNDRDAVRLEAIDALDSLGRTERLTLLAKLAQSGEHVDVRLIAIDRLVKLQGAGVSPMLQDLTNANDAAVRRAAMRALGRVGDQASVDALQAYLVDKSEGIRITAAASMLAILFR